MVSASLQLPFFVEPYWLIPHKASKYEEIFILICLPSSYFHVKENMNLQKR